MSSDFISRPHQTKSERFPKIYKMVERVLKLVKENKASVKTALYSTRIPNRVFTKVYALTYNVLKNKDIIGAILKDTKLLEKEPYMRTEAVEIMIYDMAISKSALPGDSKLVLIMKKYQTDIEDAYNKLQNTSVANSLNTYCSLPRYARIHTIAISVDDALYDLEHNGYKRIHYPSNISLKDYLALVLDLKKRQFLVDYHFKDLLVFAHKENLSMLKMYRKGKLFLEDKTSYVPVHVLAPEPASVVLDCCAAPGIKTAHLVSVMENKGIIYAMDRDAERCETLKCTLDKAGSKISHVSCKDFKDVNPNNHPYNSAKYILLDPSCSGSGMVSRMDEITDRDDCKCKERLNALAGFQIVLLKHALSFPQVQRVVYSTCSITEEENEFVVSEALRRYGHKFQLVPAMPEWPERGLPGYEHKEMFFRATPLKHLTNGFFVAVFERIVAAEDIGATEGISRRKRKRGASCEAYAPDFANEELEVDQSVLKKSKKMSKKHYLSEGVGATEGVAISESSGGLCEAYALNGENEEPEVDRPVLKKSKKKSKKHLSEDVGATKGIAISERTGDSFEAYALNDAYEELEVDRPVLKKLKKKSKKHYLSEDFGAAEGIAISESTGSLCEAYGQNEELEVDQPVLKKSKKKSKKHLSEDVGATDGIAIRERKGGSCEAYAPEGANEELEVDQPVLKKNKKKSKKHYLSEDVGATEGIAISERKGGSHEAYAPEGANEELEIDQPVLKKSKKK